MTHPEGCRSVGLTVRGQVVPPVCSCGGGPAKYVIWSRQIAGNESPHQSRMVSGSRDAGDLL